METLTCPGGIACERLRDAARREWIVSHAWALTLHGLLEAAHPAPACSVVVNGSTSRGLAALGGARSLGTVELVSRRIAPPGRAAQCACSVRVHDPAEAIVEMVRAIRRMGGPHAVEAVLAAALDGGRRATLGGHPARHVAGPPSADAGATEHAIALESLRAAALCAPERVVASRLALLLRFACGWRARRSTSLHDHSELELWLRRLSSEGVAEPEGRRLDPTARHKVAWIERGTTIWEPYEGGGGHRELRYGVGVP